MSIEEIRETLLQDLREGIDKIIKGEQQDYQNQLLCPDDVFTELENLGFVDQDDMDTNGWQWDWWKTYKFNDKTYITSGSGYYGGITISVEDEDNN